MAGSLNKVTLIGNLGKDPERREFNNGGFVVNLTIATSETWKDKNTGEKQERTEWHMVSILNEGIANVALNYLKKGSKVYIEGKMKTRKWQDQNGNDRYTTEVSVGFGGSLILLTPKGDAQQGHGQAEQQQQAAPPGYTSPALNDAPLADDDEIPF